MRFMLDRISLPAALCCAILFGLVAATTFALAQGSSTAESGSSAEMFGLGACSPGPEDVDKVTQKDRDSIIAFMEGNITYWGRKNGLWYGAYWAALALSLFGSVLAASGLLSDDIGWKRWKSYSALLAALATSFLGTFSPQLQATRFADAFAQLKVAVVTYRFDPSMTRCQLVRAYALAENMAQHGSSAAGAK